MTDQLDPDDELGEPDGSQQPDVPEEPPEVATDTVPDDAGQTGAEEEEPA
jgi:hypothetical protein